MMITQDVNQRALLPMMVWSDELITMKTLSVNVQFYVFFICSSWFSSFKDLETNIAGLNADIESFDARIKFASDIQSTAEVV